MTYTLPIELTNRNDGRGHSWHRTAADKKRILRVLTVLGHRRSKAYSHPVRLTVTRVLGANQRLWDADSILRGNAKELIDCLVALGWFHDDSAKWIAQCDGRQDATRRKDGPAVDVSIERIYE